jgi:hypothetical protein
MIQKVLLRLKGGGEEEWESGRLEESKNGRVEEWKIAHPSSGRRPLKGEVGYGKMGKWENGKME